MNKINAALFPRTVKYDHNWMIKNSLGENVLYNLESLCEVLPLKPGMRVLDLGCGKAISSIFLAKEFDVQVWAVDKWIAPTENFRRIIEMECTQSVYPMRAVARSLPFAYEFFDAIVSINSFYYFGTDERYLPYLIQYLKPNGLIGITDMCFTKEIHSFAEAPIYLKPHYNEYWYYIHTVEWWKNNWQKTDLVNILCAELLPQGEYIWEQFVQEFGHCEGEGEVAAAIANDTEHLINLFRLVGRRSHKDVYIQESEQLQQV